MMRPTRIAVPLLLIALAMASVFAQPAKPGPATSTAASTATTTSTTRTATDTGIQQSLQEILEEPSAPDSYRAVPRGGQGPFSRIEETIRVWECRPVVRGRVA